MITDERLSSSCRVLLLASLACLAVAPVKAGDVDDLRLAVRASRSGGPAAALGSGWSLGKGRAAAASVVRRDTGAPGAWSDAEVLTAALLYTERGERELEAGRASGVWFDLARDLVASASEPQRRRLQRDWTLALAAFHNARYDGTRSRALLDQAARTLADEPDVLFAAARLHEAIGSSAYSGLAEVVSANAAEAAASELTEALRLYERVLALSPGRSEARLRRGRALMLLGRRREAKAEIEPLRAAPADTDVPCLAHLFLGALREQEGHVREALACYRSAVATGRSPEVARVAIAHALGKGSETGEALRSVQELLSSRASAGDAWWRYRHEGLGEESDYEARFAALWQEARR